MNSNDPRYIVGLDPLRFAAACLVVAYHLAFWTWAYPEGQSGRAAAGVGAFEAWAPFTFLGWIGVQIFFVISGFVIAVTGATARPFRFVVGRIVRLGPALWICATVTLAASLAAGLGAPGELLAAYVRSLLFWPMPTWVDSVYWTLGVEISFYLLVFGLIVIGRFTWLKPVACFIGLGSTIYWIVYGMALYTGDGQPNELLFKVQTSRAAQLLLVQHGCFFALGVLLWWELMKQRSTSHWLWMAIFVAGGCLQILGETLLKQHKTGLAYPAVAPCALWLATLAALVLAVRGNARLLRLPPAVLRALRRLGLMTYPLYLLHNVGGAIAMAAAARAGASPVAALAAAVSLSLGASWLVSAHAEPALQRLTRRSLEGARAWAGGLLRGARQA